MRILRNACGHRSGKRLIRVMRRTVHKCRCRWHLHHRRTEMCRCPKPVSSRHCVSGNRWRTSVTIFRLSAGRCIRRHSSTFKRVRCRVGTVRHAGACDPLSRLRIITTSSRRIIGCRCRVIRRQRQCACSCGQSRRFSRCLRRPGIRLEVHLARRLTACRCTTMRRARSIRVHCPSPKRSRGPCHKLAKKADFTRVVRTVWFVRDGCQCVRKLQQKRFLCREFTTSFVLERKFPEILFFLR